jgi:tRNA A-37 threonylcarbamoyl transferase component Bud32
MFDTLKLSDLSKKHCRVLRKESNTRPVIWLVEENGIRAVVKDFSTKKFLFRNIIGRFLVWREGKAYRRLKGMKGVPTLYRVIDGLALVIEEIPGRTLENLEAEIKLPEDFFHALKDLVNRFHKRGMAHCDLKRAANTMLGHDGLPYIIDWGASISETEFRLSPLNLIYRRFLLDDYLAIVKLKLRHIPESVTQAERNLHSHRSRAERLLRGIRDRLRETLQKIV